MTSVIRQRVLSAGNAAVDQPCDFLSKGPADPLEAPRYMGFLAHLTAVVWLAPAFAGFLALDDLFLLHEAVYPTIGVLSIGTAAAYAILAAAFLWWFRPDIRSVDDERVLAAALLVLAGPAAVDELLYELYVLENGLKALGVAPWAVFGVRAASQHLRDALDAREASDLARRTA